ncbi:hypothetical protein ACSSS7_001051 [Eimeria intestinalis]
MGGPPPHQAAEAYLMSVHLEAQALPSRVAAACIPTNSSKHRTTAAAAAASDAAASLNKGSPCKSSKHRSSSSSSSSSSARYIRQLLRLQGSQEQQQQHPPHPAWEAEALDFFKRIRLWLQQQRELVQQQQQHQQQQQQQEQQQNQQQQQQRHQRQQQHQQQQQEEQQRPFQLHLRCATWTPDEWRLYCRTYPPTLPLLLSCDARCCCLLLQLLLEDLELQLQHDASVKCNHSKTGISSAAEAAAATTEAALTAAKATAGAELAGAEAEATEAAAAPAVEAAAEAAVSLPADTSSCCFPPGSSTSLPQLFWLFVVLAALDQVEKLLLDAAAIAAAVAAAAAAIAAGAIAAPIAGDAIALRFEVSYVLQRLRRRCLRLRDLVLRLLGCTDSCSSEEQRQQQLKRLQKAVPFVSVLTTTQVTTGHLLQHQEGLKQHYSMTTSPAEEVALRQQLAALDSVLLIIRDFYGQK